MAEESRTLRDWAGCVVTFPEEATAELFSQDGSFERVDYEAPGQVLLTLRAGRGIDVERCTWSFGAFKNDAGLVTAVSFKMEHVSDEQKRVLIYDGANQALDHPFALNIKNYTAVVSTATG